MTDEKDGATTDAEKLVGKELTQLRAQLKEALDEIETKIKEIANLKLQNTMLTTQAESQVKGKLIEDIRMISDYGIEYLTECSVDRLEQILSDSKMIKKPLFSSSGDFGKRPDSHEKLRNMFKFNKRK
jgi:hypothetical protein